MSGSKWLCITTIALQPSTPKGIVSKTKVGAILDPFNYGTEEVYGITAITWFLLVLGPSLFIYPHLFL